MDALEKWRIIRFTPYQTTTLYQNGCSLKNFSFILAAKWLVQHSIRHPINSDNLRLLFSIIPSSMTSAL